MFSDWVFFLTSDTTSPFEVLSQLLLFTAIAHCFVVWSCGLPTYDYRIYNYFTRQQATTGFNDIA